MNMRRNYLSVDNPKAYSAIWRAENRDKVRVYNRNYQRKRRALIRKLLKANRKSKKA